MCVRLGQTMASGLMKKEWDFLWCGQRTTPLDGWHSEGIPRPRRRLLLLQIGDVMRARGGSVALWMGRVPGRCYSKQGDGHICRGCRQLPPEMKNKIPSSPASRIASPSTCYYAKSLRATCTMYQIRHTSKPAARSTRVPPAF